MTVFPSLPLAEVDAHLSELVERVGSRHERVLVTVRGEPCAVLVAPADLESLEGTTAVLSDGGDAALEDLRGRAGRRPG